MKQTKETETTSVQLPEKLDLRSHDITEDTRTELLRLFPEVRTEDGKIDFDRLKLVLGETVDVGKERYGMVWPGKADCFKTIQQPSLGTLRPCREESVNFDTTENLIIEGDNLEVLKLLQKSYLGKVKMIYIDPPYNTGNDFIYPDNYTESLQTYLEYTGQVDAEGKKFNTNTEVDGRFHSKWLSMMYPRLYLARNLLREDGVIFISIDDQEATNIRKLCDDIFGEENLIAQFVWRSRLGKGGTAKQVAPIHEYVITYAKSANLLEFRRDINVNEGGRERLRQWGQGDKREDRPSMYYDIPGPNDVRVFPVKPDGTDGRWRVGKEKMQELITAGLVAFELRKDGCYEAYRVIPAGHETQSAIDSILSQEEVTTTADGSKELKALFSGDQYFDYPKPSSLLRYFVGLIQSPSAIVLDFFAGSGTTAQAILDLNKQDGGDRKFILVQLPEPCAEDSAAYKAGFKTIAKICKERVRRVIKKLNDEDTGKLDLEGAKKHDRGFRVFKLAESNFKPWNADAPHVAQALEQQLELHINHIREGHTADDLLYEILLKSGFPLTTKVETLMLAGKTVYSVADGAMLICLERELTHEVIKEMAVRKPERVVCLDEGFAGNDQLKTNAAQAMKAKGVTSFKTV